MTDLDNIILRSTPEVAEIYRQEIKELFGILIIEALETDGGHHKQWYLERLADLLDIKHDNEGVAP